MLNPSYLCTIDNNSEYTIPIKAFKHSKSTTPVLFDETTNDLCELHSISYKLTHQNLTAYLPQDKINNLATTITFTPISSHSKTPLPSLTSNQQFDISSPSTTSIPPGMSFTTQLPFHIACPENFNPIFSSNQQDVTTQFTTSILGTFATINNNSATPMTLDPTMIIGTVHFNYSNTPLQRLQTQPKNEQPPHTWRKGMFHRLS